MVSLSVGSGCEEPCVDDFCLTQVDTKNFNFVVKAKIYPEDPDTLLLTMRGGGLTTLDVSSPASPTILTHWDASGDAIANDVEGQDRIGDVLVVVGRNGFLHLLDVSDPSSIVEIGLLDIPGYDGEFAALHVKVYSHVSGRVYAMVTSAQRGFLVAVDISDPEDPTFVAELDTQIAGLEGIYVKNVEVDGQVRGYAFVGGFRSTDFSVIDLTNLDGADVGQPAMKIIRTLSHAHYVEMVSEANSRYPDTLFCALWGERSGGVATFDISDPANMVELDHLDTFGLARANRIKIQGDYAFLPLEQNTGGGIGIVNISDPSNLADPSWNMNISGISIPYTLAIKDEYIYVFGTTNDTMAVLRMDQR